MPRFRASRNDQINTAEQSGQRGWLLASSAVLILVIVAMVASFTFVMKRTSHFQGNYAAGQRLADLAVMSHYYAQNERYTKGNFVDGADIYGGMDLPDNFAFAPVENTIFSIEVRGADAAPFGATSLQAASAYLHLRVRPYKSTRAPSDNAALLAGASHHGMARVGFYKVDPSDNCHGQDTAVRWGSEDTACLNTDDILQLGFTDLQEGDIIVPAWETASAQMQANAVLRFPQPERSTSNIMEADINMKGLTDVQTHKITNAKDVNTSNLNTTRSPTGTATIKDLVVTGTTEFSGETTINPGVDVNGIPNNVTVSSNSGGNVMKVDNNFTFTLDGSMMVGGNLVGGVGGGNLDVVSTSDVSVNDIGQDGGTIVVDPRTGTDISVGIRNINDPLKTLLIKQGTSLAVAGDIKSKTGDGVVFGPPPGSASNTLEMYAAQLTTSTDFGTPTNITSKDPTNNPVAWTINSISQVGNDAQHQLAIDTVKVDDCFSLSSPSACPQPKSPAEPF